MHAAIVIGRFPALELAGLPMLDRLVLTAAAAGCDYVHLIGRDAEQAVAGLQAKTRAATTIEPLGTAASMTVTLPTDEADRLLVLHGDCVIGSRELRAFVKFATAAPDPIAIAAGQGPAPEHPAAVDLSSGTQPTIHTLGLAVAPRPTAGLLVAGGWQAFLDHLRDEQAAGRAAVYEVERGGACLLVAEGDKAAAERSLIRAAGKDSDGLVSRLINRRVSGLATRLLLKTSITPNAITWALLGLGLITGAALLYRSESAVVLGALLYQINSMLDGCDGEIARVRFASTRFGAWADTLSDQVTNLTFFLALPLGVYRRTGEPLHLGLALFITFGVVTLLAAVYLKSRRTSDDAHFSDYGRSLVRALPAGSLVARAVAVISTLLRRDSYALLFLLLALCGADELIVYLIAGGVALHFVSILLPAAAPSEQSA
jgi:phosphatidylglycerophosphate synthase